MYRYNARSRIEEKVLIARYDYTRYLGDYGYIRGDKEPPTDYRLNHPMVEWYEEKVEKQNISIREVRRKFIGLEEYIKTLSSPLYNSHDTRRSFGYVRNEYSLLDFCDYFKIPYEIAFDYSLNNSAYKYETEKYTKWVKRMKVQYEIGKLWEDTVIDYYNSKGYFVHKIPTLNSGTVFDIIAIHNGAALCIECKHIRGGKLYYKGSGLGKKSDELDHFVNETGTNVYIYVYSDTDGAWWTTWKRSSELLKEKGYLEKSDCFPCEIELNGTPKDSKLWLDLR